MAYDQSPLVVGVISPQNNYKLYYNEFMCPPARRKTMLTGENHEWMGTIIRFGFALLIIIIFAIPLIQYLSQP